MKIKDKVIKWLWFNLGILRLEISLLDRITALEKLVQVGVDIHTISDSWAVLCIAGKPEYVTFRRLKSDDVRYISQLLHQMERRYGDVKTDVPPFAREHFKFH